MSKSYMSEMKFGSGGVCDLRIFLSHYLLQISEHRPGRPNFRLQQPIGSSTLLKADGTPEKAEPHRATPVKGASRARRNGSTGISPLFFASSSTLCFPRFSGR